MDRQKTGLVSKILMLIPSFYVHFNSVHCLNYLTTQQLCNTHYLMTLDYRNREVEEDARGTLMISKQYGNHS